MDKDFRSLEHKIRDVVTESMARNSAKRMQVTNVARPDTATDPTDVKSKIAKQGEIKTKIIDEEQLDELGPDTLSSYKSKAADSEKQLTDKSSSLKVPAQDRNDAAVKANQRRQGMQLATKKLGEEAEDKQYIKTVSPTGALDHKEVHSSKAYDALNSFKKRGYKATIVSRKTASVKEEVEQVDEAGLPSGMLGKYSGTPSQKTVNFRGTISQTNKQLKDYKARGYVVHKHTEDNGKHNYTMKHPDIKEEVEQVDEVSSALLYRAKQAAQKKAGWLMPGDKGKGDKAWNRVKKFRDAGVKKQDQERKQALTKEELALSVAEAYGKGYKSPWDKIEKAKPGIGKRIDAHADDLKKSAADYQAVVDKDKKKDVKEGAVPDSWEDNSPQKRKATAKKVAADSMDHDKTAKIVEAAKADDAKPGDMDDTDPKKIKGGKTEVDLNPKTDDRTEDETTQDKAGKSAAAKANKEIGQKSKPVKEEAMSEKNFGLPESLIDIVTETLKGGQKKLDKNHNGKIDGQDFKILRGDTKVKAKPQYDKARPAFKEEVEEAEQIDELSNKTLKSYISKANDGWHPDSTLNLAAAAANKMNSRRGKDIESAVRLRKKAEKRGEGVVKAASKMAKEEVELSTDELARIEEIAKKL